jgi:polycomb protein EED
MPPSVAFYGDKVLSRANHDDVIVLWEILGFSSTNPPPSRAPLPQIPQPNDHGPGQFTRSAFLPSTSPDYQLQYERLLQLHTPRCKEMFFMRFQLHHQPNQNPVLCFCNKVGEIFFWDFERVRAYGDILKTLKDQSSPVRLPRWLGRLGVPSTARSQGLGSRLGSMESSQTPEIDSTRNITSLDEVNPKVLSDWNSMYSDRDGSLSLEPHHKIDQFRAPTKKPGRKAAKAEIVGRQVAWSPGGEWCVVAGSSNLVQVLRRWNRFDIDDRLGRADLLHP